MSTAIDIREMGPDDVPFVAQLLESVGADASGLEAPRFVGELRLIAERAGELLAYACWLPDGRLGQMAAIRSDEWDIIAKQMVDKALYRVQRAGAGCCHLELPSAAADPFWRQVRWAKTQSPSCRRLAGATPPASPMEPSSAIGDSESVADSPEPDLTQAAGEEVSAAHVEADTVASNEPAPTDFLPTETPVGTSTAEPAEGAPSDEGIEVEVPPEDEALSAAALVTDDMLAEIEESADAVAETETEPAENSSPEDTEQADALASDDTESEHRPSRAA